MKKSLLLICVMLLTCVSVVNAQTEPQEIQFIGKLVNPTTTLNDYIIRVVKVGERKILEEVKPAEDGSFDVTVTSNRAVRLIVLNKQNKKKVIFSRSFFGVEGNHTMVLNEIDLSTGTLNKTQTDN